MLVVGSGQSGCRIAENLHLAGRTVHLVVGGAPRCPRVYRGRHAVEWLADLGQYDPPVDRHPRGEGVRRQANHDLIGRDGGRAIDLRAVARDGMAPHGRLRDIADGHMHFTDDLAKNLDGADAVYDGIYDLIDRDIAPQDISALPPARYGPVWQPGPHPPSLDMRAPSPSLLLDDLAA